MKAKNFKKDEWITTADGKIAQITKGLDEYGCVTYDNGYCSTVVHGDTEVYPFTIHTKVIAEEIAYYTTEFNRKGILYPKTGRKLEEFGHRLMNIPESAPNEEYKKVYSEIKSYMQELEKHISYFKD